MKTNRIFCVIMVMVMVIELLSCIVLAYDPSNITGDYTTPAANKVELVGERILGIVQVVGTIAAVVTLILLGVKYMTGSIEEKAEYKKTLMPYVIGAVFVLGATNITKWIYDASLNFF